MKPAAPVAITLVAIALFAAASAARAEVTDRSATGFQIVRTMEVAKPPAAAWAAKAGDPVLWSGKDSLPAATKAAITAHRRPHIYVLGPASAISDAVRDCVGRPDTHYALGSVLNHVLLHQTMIGLEAK